MINNDFKDVLLNRKSVRRYEENHMIPPEILQQIMTETLTTPTTFNLQPCRFKIFQTAEEKALIAPLLTENALQMQTSSAMILLVGDYQCFDKGEAIYQSQVDAGYITSAEKNSELSEISAYYDPSQKESLVAPIQLDAGLYGMTLMLACRHYGYDTCAIGGFDKQRILPVVGIDSQRYFPILFFSIGKAAEAGAPTTRLSLKEMLL